MKVLVCGGRDFADEAAVTLVLGRLLRPGDVVVHGAARGADSMSLGSEHENCRCAGCRYREYVDGTLGCDACVGPWPTGPRAVAEVERDTFYCQDCAAHAESEEPLAYDSRDDEAAR